MHFGSAESDLARSFNIFNDGEEILEYQITKTAIWVDSISRVEGKVSAGNIQPIVVVINRDKLYEKENKTTIHISSNSGSKQMILTATNNRTNISLNILEPTEITATSAILNAEILNEGNPKYTERGFVYNTEPTPSIDKTIAILTASVTDDKKFSSKVEGLKLNQDYYVRAYAKNILGIVYSSNSISFKANASFPTVSTQEVSQINIALGTATFNGSIEFVGDPAYTERGFVYGPVPNPTIDGNKKVVLGNDQGSYSANVSELTEGLTYYVRAYATNAEGTVYGEEVSFNFTAAMPTITTLPVTNIKIGQGTVTFNGRIETLGDLEYIERGFVYNTTHNPTIDDKKLLASGSGTGAYSLNATAIQEGSVYYVRAYVQNAKGVVYGEEVSFNFTATMPTVSTLSATNISIAAGVATLHGRIDRLGDLEYTERGFVYGTLHNPMIESDNKVSVLGSGLGEYSVNLSSLTMGAVYYVRAYVVNEKGVTYGEEIVLDMNAKMPEVITGKMEFKSTTSAVFNGTITDLGDPAYTEHGFVYGTMPIPSLDNGAVNVVVEGVLPGAFNTEVSGLEVDETYHVRAYAISLAGVVYGEIEDLIMTDPDYLALPTAVYGGHTYRVYTEMGAMSQSAAKEACDTLAFGGYDDWYLPNKSELSHIANSHILPLSKGRSWWSSEGYGYLFYDNKSWIIASGPTSSIYNVCAVRKED